MINIVIENRDKSSIVHRFKADNLAVESLGINTSKNNKSTALCLMKSSLTMQHWQYYIEQKIGFILPNEQAQWLSNAVEQTAANHKLSLAELWDAIQVDYQLLQLLIDRVLIPESRFFRHQPSIEFVTELAIKHNIQVSKKNVESGSDNVSDNNCDGNSRPFRVWSVGCAAGQEVWSLAMILAAKNQSNYRILGTDVNRQALAKARRGHYHQRQQKLIPAVYQSFTQPLIKSEQKNSQAASQGYLSETNQGALTPPIIAFNQAAPNKLYEPLSDRTLTHWQVVPRLHEQVSFNWHNVFTQDVATPHLQQVIMCQNMLIYFRQFDQRDILTRLAAQCVLGGYIVLAPGEALFWRPSNMRRVDHLQVNAWQKISA